jgi:hypothetical protein
MNLFRRLFGPLLLTAMAVYVAVHNGDAERSNQIVLVGVDRLVGKDPFAQGTLTSQLLGGIAAFAVTLNLLLAWRSSRALDDELLDE